MRRRDPVWGTGGRKAALDTFAYPNAAPQASAFNQGEAALGRPRGPRARVRAGQPPTGLGVHRARSCADDDLVYRGVEIPRRFWKVAAWASPRTCATTAFVLDQTPFVRTLQVEVPALGPFRTFQVPVVDVQELTGIDLGPLVGADVLAPVGALATASAGRR